MNKEIDEILVKPGSQWTNEESAKIYKLMNSGQKAVLQARMDTLRDESVKQELGVER